MTNKVILIISFLCLAIGVGFAQQERVPTIEELYLEDPTLLLISEYAQADDRDSKLYALNEIENLINENNISGNEESVLAVLQYLSMEGDRHVVMENNRVINYFPMVRKKSTELLGRLGAATSNIEFARKAKDLLLFILGTDIEVMVKSEAAYALGVIGLNEGGDVVYALANVTRVQTTLAPDNNFAYAVILAIEKIADTNNGISEFEAYQALITIMQGNYNRMVRDKALEVLNKIKAY